MIHYHIRWSNTKLDWQTFRTPTEAEAEAQRLRLPGESYTIEQFDSNCERCGVFRADDLAAAE